MKGMNVKLKMVRGASLLFFSLCCATFFLFAQAAPLASAHSLATTTGMVRFMHAAVGVTPSVPAAGVNGATTAQGTTAQQQGTLPTPVPAAGANGVAPAQQGAAVPAQGTLPQATTPAMAMGVAGAPGSVDVFVDGQGVATQLAYGAATNYLPIAAGTHMIQFAPTGKGANAALLRQQVTVPAGVVLQEIEREQNEEEVPLLVEFIQQLQRAWRSVQPALSHLLCLHRALVLS